VPPRGGPQPNITEELTTLLGPDKPKGPRSELELNACYCPEHGAQLNAGTAALR